MKIDDFIARIREIEKNPDRKFIVNAELPLAIYYEADASGTARCRIEAVGKGVPSAGLHSTKGIAVSIEDLAGKKFLSLALTDPSAKRVFETFCFDLVDAARQPSAGEAFRSVYERFLKWQSLFGKEKPGTMSDAEQQGLMAELKAIVDFSDIMPFSKVVESWLGPCGKDRDFEFGSTWAEIKSCPISAIEITISSLEQLDSDLPGKLLVYRMDRLLTEKSDMLSLKDMVDAVRELADRSGFADRELLEVKLLLAKYVDAEPAYEVKKFRFGEKCVYDVSGNEFPRLRRGSVPAGISNCKYRINIGAIEGFKNGE